MGFCSELCGGVAEAFRSCLYTPITRKKIYWAGGISLAIILFIIILCVSLPGSSTTPPSGRDALRESPLSVGINYKLATFHETTTVEKFDKTLIDYIKQSLIKVQILGVTTACNSQYNDSLSLTLSQVDYLNMLIPSLGLRLSRSYQDIQSASSLGSVSGVIALSGGQSLDLRLAAIRNLYNNGVRIMSVAADKCNTPWAISADKNDNVTNPEFLKAAVREMNRLGVLIDIAGASVDTQDIILEESKAPVAAIGIGIKTLKDDPMNLDMNKIAAKFKSKNGLLMLTMDCNLYAKDSSNCTKKDFTGLLSQAKKEGFHLGLGGAFGDSSVPPKDLTFKDLPAYFDGLHSSGYSMQFLKGLAGDNFLHTLKVVEDYAKKNKKSLKPVEVLFDKTTLDNSVIGCYTDVQPKPAPKDGN